MFAYHDLQNQNTPLHYAAAYELQLPRERLAVLLMEYGADVAAKNQVSG